MAFNNKEVKGSYIAKSKVESLNDSMHQGKGPHNSTPRYPVDALHQGSLPGKTNACDPLGTNMHQGGSKKGKK